MKKAVEFAKARQTSLYGSKAVGLGEAARAGLPVPPGIALSGDLVEAIASGNPQAIEMASLLSLSVPVMKKSVTRWKNFWGNFSAWRP